MVDIGKDATGKRKQKMKRGFITKEDAEKALNYYITNLSPEKSEYKVTNDSEYAFMILNQVKKLPSQDINFEYSTMEITNYFNTNIHTVRKILSRNKDDFFNNNEVRTIVDDELKIYKSVNKVRGGRAFNLFNIDGVLRIGLLLQSNEISEEIKKLIIKSKIPVKYSNFVHSKNRAFLKQNKLQTALFESLKDLFEIQTQVYCGNYRLDFVVDDNLVIECDEFGHSNYNSTKEKIRESYIKSKGYKIIRFNPDDKDENVFKLINKILHTKHLKIS